MGWHHWQEMAGVEGKKMDFGEGFDFFRVWGLFWVIFGLFKGEFG